MTTETTTDGKQLQISFDDGDFSTGTVSILLDLDFRTGTPVDETVVMVTEWLISLFWPWVFSKSSFVRVLDY